MASKVATQPMPANQRRLGSDRKASRLKGFELWPLEAEVEEVEALSSSTLRSLEGARPTLLVVSGFFSGGPTVVGAAVDELEGLVGGEAESRNRLGDWLVALAGPGSPRSG